MIVLLKKILANLHNSDISLTKPLKICMKLMFYTSRAFKHLREIVGGCPQAAEVTSELRCWPASGGAAALMVVRVMCMLVLDGCDFFLFESFVGASAVVGKNI